MRVILALTTLGLATVVAAQQADVSNLVSQIPSCALPCINSGATSAGCGTSDFSCQCDKSAQIASSAATCLATSCSLDDTGKALDVSTRICLALVQVSTSAGAGLYPTTTTALPGGTGAAKPNGAAGRGAGIAVGMLAAAGAVAAVL